METISGNHSIAIVIMLYLLFMLAIGFYYYKRNEDLSDYILGGRKLNKWVTALSSQASDMSGWLLLGLPVMRIFQGWKRHGLPLVLVLERILTGSSLPRGFANIQKSR